MVRHGARQIGTALHDLIFVVRMAVGRWGLGGFLNAGDEIGCVDALWSLRVFISMKFKEYSGVSTSATVYEG